MQGWIRLPRNIQETKLYKSKCEFKLFLHLILVAQHTDTTYENKILKRGCLSSSYKQLSRQTGLTEHEIYEAMENLVDWKEVKVDNEMGVLHISILKYEQYQDKDVEQGWVKIYRNIVDWEWYKNLNSSLVFVYMILKANYKNESCNDLNGVIYAGSCVTSVSRMIEEIPLTRKEIRNALKNLKESNNVTWRRCGRFTIYSVTNYCDWQFSDVHEQEVENNVIGFEQKVKQNERKSNEGQTEGKLSNVSNAQGGKRKANSNNNNIYNGFKKGDKTCARRSLLHNYQSSTGPEVAEEFERLFLDAANS